MTNEECKAGREVDVNKIVTSKHPKKIVVAGPGTGKSFLFQKLIKEKKKEGKSNFLAITFIGKLGDNLADDLCGLADTYTMHGFARKLINKLLGWWYYPNIYQIIEEDLKKDGVTDFAIGDKNYLSKSKFYKTAGHADVIHYVVEVMKNDNSKIPIFDLILVDEFQDFNKEEAELIDLLALKNEVVVAGDDDQALYRFKGSSPDFIRDKYSDSNTDFESHTLRFCSRCTEIIMKYFNAIVEKYNLNDPAKSRINKEYICYLPDKTEDSEKNKFIHLIQNCPSGMAAYKIQKKLETMIGDQKVKDVLIIGEGRSCKANLLMIANQLKRYGFKNVDYNDDNGLLSFNSGTIDAYKFLSQNEESEIGWRLLGDPADKEERKQHIKNAKNLKIIISGTSSQISGIGEKGFQNLEKNIGSDLTPDNQIKRELLIRELKDTNSSLPRPLCNLNITVCNILNSKGLGADVVFLIGFDKKRFPSTPAPTDDEIYQMLVAITRAKKRLYLINSSDKDVSDFIGCLDASDVRAEKIKYK
ncbi:MAG: UvrD-helicase domain-containing protein [Patescibacteria group bacterium]